MYRYDGILRLDGNVYNEVEKAKMSAAEVMVLRKLHGNDAFRDLHETGNDKSNYDEEREKLMRIYVADGKLESRSKFNEQNFVMMFGPAHMKLPERLIEFTAAEAAAAEEAEMLEEIEAEEKTDPVKARMAHMRAMRGKKTVAEKLAVKKAAKKINKNSKTNRRVNKTDTKMPTLAELAG